MTNNCAHVCPACEGVFEHTGSDCREGYFGLLCVTCVQDGYFMRECEACGHWMPFKKGWVCVDCRERKVRVA